MQIAEQDAVIALCGIRAGGALGDGAAEHADGQRFAAFGLFKEAVQPLPVAEGDDGALQQLLRHLRNARVLPEHLKLQGIRRNGAVTFSVDGDGQYGTGEGFAPHREFKVGGNLLPVMVPFRNFKLFFHQFYRSILFIFEPQFQPETAFLADDVFRSESAF